MAFHRNSHSSFESDCHFDPGINSDSDFNPDPDSD